MWPYDSHDGRWANDCQWVTPCPPGDKTHSRVETRDFSCLLHAIWWIPTIVTSNFCATCKKCRTHWQVSSILSAASVTVIYRRSFLSTCFRSFLWFVDFCLCSALLKDAPSLAIFTCLLTVRRSEYINIHGNDWSDGVTFCTGTVAY